MALNILSYENTESSRPTPIDLSQLSCRQVYSCCLKWTPSREEHEPFSASPHATHDTFSACLVIKRYSVGLILRRSFLFYSISRVLMINGEWETEFECSSCCKPAFLRVSLVRIQGLDQRIIVGVPTLQRNFDLYFPRKGIARPQFRHSCACEPIYSIPTIGPTIFLQQNRQTDHGNIHYKSLTETWTYWDCGRAVPFLGMFF
jgi:hypothetical protein